MSGTELLAIRGCQNSQRTGDVVFVHGLNGNPRQYWCYGEKQENYWPAWLGDDLPEVGVWSLGYENAAFKSRKVTLLGGMGFRGFAMPLMDRAENVLLQLKQEGIGTRPLVLVTHSMGGLLAKQLLRTANDSPDPKYHSILEQTRGVCFIATPHIGSDLAKWGTYFRMLGANVSMDELRPHEPLLRSLKQWYSNFAVGGPTGIKTLSFYEMKPMPGLGIPVVEAGDADPGVPLTNNYPLDEDHSSICRPNTKDSLLYREVLAFVRDECFQIPADRPVLSGATQDQAAGVVPPWPPVKEGEDTSGRPGSAFPLIRTLAFLVLVAGAVFGVSWYMFLPELLSFKTLYDNLCPNTGDLTALAKITKHLNRTVHWEGIVTKTVSGGGYIRTFNIKPVGAKDGQRPCESVTVYPKPALEVTLFGANPDGIRVMVKGRFATFDSLNGAEIMDATVRRLDR